MPVLLLLGDATTPTNVPGTSAGDIFGLIAVLLIMVAVLVAAYWLTKRIASGTFRMQAQMGRMRAVDRMMLARDRAVVVVELDGRYYMLGVGNSITMLGEVDGAMYRAEGDTGHRQAAGFFAALQDRLRPRPAPPPYEGPVGESDSSTRQEEIERAVERMRMRTQQRWKQDEESRDDDRP